MSSSPSIFAAVFILILSLIHPHSTTYANKRDDFNQSKNCSSVRLDDPGESMHRLPIRNQLYDGLCYSYAAADLIDAYRFSQITGDKKKEKFNLSSPFFLGVQASRIKRVIYEKHVKELSEKDPKKILRAEYLEKYNFYLAQKSELLLKNSDSAISEEVKNNLLFLEAEIAAIAEMIQSLDHLISLRKEVVDLGKVNIEKGIWNGGDILSVINNYQRWGVCAEKLSQENHSRESTFNTLKNAIKYFKNYQDYLQSYRSHLNDLDFYQSVEELVRENPTLMHDWDYKKKMVELLRPLLSRFRQDGFHRSDTLQCAFQQMGFQLKDFVVSQKLILNTLEATDVEKAIEKLLWQMAVSCDEEKRIIDEVPNPIDKTIRTPQQFAKIIDSAFNQAPGKRLPVGISYCSNILHQADRAQPFLQVTKDPQNPLKEERNCEINQLHQQHTSHASTIIGRRFNQQTKRCQVLIKNSWGPDCQKKILESPQTNLEPGQSKVTATGRKKPAPSIVPTHAPIYAWDCEAGKIWVDLEQMAQNTLNVTYFP